MGKKRKKNKNNNNKNTARSNSWPTVYSMHTCRYMYCQNVLLLPENYLWYLSTFNISTHSTLKYYSFGWLPHYPSNVLSQFQYFCSNMYNSLVKHCIKVLKYLLVNVPGNKCVSMSKGKLFIHINFKLDILHFSDYLKFSDYIFIRLMINQNIFKIVLLLLV